MMYLIKAKVLKRVAGISGNFTSTEGKLVNADNLSQAQRKFEHAIRASAAYMDCDSITFEYLEIFDEVK
jgi:hypothetical protein